MAEQITVYLRSNTNTNKVGPISPTATVLELKELAEKELGQPKESMRLIYSGSRLGDTDKLSDLGIHNESKINLLFQSPTPTRAQKNSQEQSLFELSETGKTWTVRNFFGGQIDLKDGNIKQGVNIENCIQTEIKIPSKVNHILINNCAHLTLFFSGVISSLEIVNTKTAFITCTGPVGNFQIDISDHIAINVESTIPGITQTKFVTSNASECSLNLLDQDLLFSIPTSMFSEQIASRLSHNEETKEWVLKSLNVEKMKAHNVIDLNMLDSAQKE